MQVKETTEAQQIDALPKLYDLQVIDLRVGELLDLRAELDDGSQKQGDLDRAEARLAQVKQQLADLESRRNEALREQAMLTDRREKNQHRLWNEVPSPDEAEKLQEDLQSTARRLDQLERDLLDFSNRMEPLHGQQEDEQRTVNELQGELEEVRAQFAEEVKDIDVELRMLSGARKAQAAEVEPVLLERYDMIRRRRGDPGVVKVEEEVCEACQTQLTSYMLRQLQLRQRVHQCENCNTILYWAGVARPVLWLDDLRDHPDAAELFEDEE